MPHIVHNQPAVATLIELTLPSIDGHLKEVSAGQWVLAPILLLYDELVNWDRVVGYVKMQLVLYLC